MPVCHTILLGIVIFLVMNCIATASFIVIVIENHLNLAMKYMMECSINYWYKLHCWYAMDIVFSKILLTGCHD